MQLSFSSFITFASHRIQQQVQKLQNQILLHIMYLIGIGLTSMFAKLMFKKFLDRELHKTSWQTPNSKVKITEMF